MDGELYLRLLVEDAVANAAATTHDVLRRLDVLRMAGRALAAAGAVDAAVATRLAGECELALALRGADWLPFALADLPRLDDLLEASRRNNQLDRVVPASGGAAVLEVWSDAVRVRTPGHVITTPGSLAPGPDVIEVATGGVLHAFDVRAAIEVVDVEPSVAAVDAGELVDAWGTGRAVAAAALHAAGLVATAPEEAEVVEADILEPAGRDRFEIVARRARTAASPTAANPTAATVTVSVIQDASIVHARVDGREVQASWVVSSAGLHRAVGDEPFAYAPAFPPPPASLTLVLVLSGSIVEVPLR